MKTTNRPNFVPGALLRYAVPKRKVGEVNICVAMWNTPIGTRVLEYIENVDETIFVLATDHKKEEGYMWLMIMRNKTGSIGWLLVDAWFLSNFCHLNSPQDI